MAFAMSVHVAQVSPSVTREDRAPSRIMAFIQATRKNVAWVKRYPVRSWVIH